MRRFASSPAHAFFVLEHENGFGAAEDLLLTRLSVRGRRRRGDTRQKNAEGGAFSELAFGADMTAALPNDAVAGGETEAALVPVAFGREEGLEEPRFDLVAQAGAVVSERNGHVFSGGEVNCGG